VTAKEEILALVSHFPPDASYDDISEKVQVMAAIRRSKASIAAGKCKTQEQVEEIFRGWADKWQAK
jgi:hypothetical protein